MATTNSAPQRDRTSANATLDDIKPTLGAHLDTSRCVSSASTASHGSATTDGSRFRESLGSDSSGFSRQSSGSYGHPSMPPLRSPSSNSRLSDASSRYSTMSMDRPVVKRRGYMRPQGTDFAASARSRDSVLSLGSIKHLQYYFARTGLLDGKGAQLARKRQQKAHTLDLSQLDPSSFLSPNKIRQSSDVDSSYASMGSSPDLGNHGFGGAGALVESPIQDEPIPDDIWDQDEFEEPDPNMLPPTTSTYNNREKPLPKPPSLAALKSDLRAALSSAAEALESLKTEKLPSDDPPTPTITTPDGKTHSKASMSWHEVQGMHILDVMTLAIRAAKVYYTSHEHPDRLDAIRPEKQVRADLLNVMEILKRMAARSFAGGARAEEIAAMNSWIASLYSMLSAEEDAEAAEKADRAGWKWLRDEEWPRESDPARAAVVEREREHAFLTSMLHGAPAPEGLPDAEQDLPAWTPIDASQPLDATVVPTPFLKHMQNGIRLVQLHNCAVRKSRRRFGAIPTYHADTAKPYRAADNLRYWAKAAELRFELILKIDALAIVYNNNPAAWVALEQAILAWCRKVRGEIAAELLE